MLTAHHVASDLSKMTSSHSKMEVSRIDFFHMFFDHHTLLETFILEWRY